MNPVVIFGASGQDGYYLGRLLEAADTEVVRVSRSGEGIRGDIADQEFVSGLINRLKPSRIYHLAANSSTRHDVLSENHATISTGTKNILEAVYRCCPECRVFLTGSGVQFVNTGVPVLETDPFEAANAYSAERIYSVYLGRYFRRLGLKVFIGYLFHHESPMRKPSHISQKIIQAVKNIAAGSREKLSIGDISVRKEWAFAGDIAAGILTLTEQENVFEAVIGSGKAFSIEDWLEACFGLAGMNWQEHVEIVPGFLPEYKLLVSNPQTIRSLGWKTEVEFRQLAEMMFYSGCPKIEEEAGRRL